MTVACGSSLPPPAASAAARWPAACHTACRSAALRHVKQWPRLPVPDRSSRALSAILARWGARRPCHGLLGGSASRMRRVHTGRGCHLRPRPTVRWPRAPHSPEQRVPRRQCPPCAPHGAVADPLRAPWSACSVVSMPWAPPSWPRSPRAETMISRRAAACRSRRSAPVEAYDAGRPEEQTRRARR